MSDEIVVESIRKMLALKMQDDDIVGSLVDAGVDYDHAVEMLDAVKTGKTIKSEKRKESESDFEDSDLVDSEELSEEEEFLEEKPRKKGKDKDVFKEVNGTSLGVWQEGVLSIINEKLEDISAKQKRLTEEINTKVKELTSAELTKMNAMIGSQRALLVTKVDATLNAKGQELKQQIENTLRVVQQVNTDTQKKLHDIAETVNSLQDMKKTLSAQIETVQAIKQELSETVDTIRRNTNSEMENLFIQHRSQLEAITNRLNSTMNLSAKILESLVKATKDKVETESRTKVDEFLEDLKAKLSVEDINKALAKLESIKDFEKKISDIVDMKVSTAMGSIDTSKYEESITDLNKRIMEMEKRTKSVDPDLLEELESKVDELMLYKEQNSKLLAKMMGTKKEIIAKKNPTAKKKTKK